MKAINQNPWNNQNRKLEQEMPIKCRQIQNDQILNQKSVIKLNQMKQKDYLSDNYYLPPRVSNGNPSYLCLETKIRMHSKNNPKR